MSHYYIYKITQQPGNMVKQLQKIKRFKSYKDAKKEVSALRINKADDDPGLYKIIFAESELDAEEKLHEKREEQIIQEWEK